MKWQAEKSIKAVFESRSTSLCPWRVHTSNLQCLKPSTCHIFFFGWLVRCSCQFNQQEKRAARDLGHAGFTDPPMEKWMFTQLWGMRLKVIKRKTLRGFTTSKKLCAGGYFVHPVQDEVYMDWLLGPSLPSRRAK